MSKKKVTIRDVAEQCGYSIYTVSCVLNNKGSITPATRKKVQQTIRKLNYDPMKNIPLARNLAPWTIALVLPDFYSEVHPFYSQAISSLRSFASQHDCDMKLFTVTDFTNRMTTNPTRSLTLGFDSLVVFCCDLSSAHIRLLTARNIPVAMIRRQMESRGVIGVMDDDRRGIKLALQHLHMVHGHTNIGLLADVFHQGIPQIRRNSYLEYIREHNLPEKTQLQLEAGQVRKDLGKQLQTMIHAEAMTALVCLEDGLAINASKVLLDMGYQIGKDIAITGYNNSRDADLFYPGITSVDIPAGKMVAAACQALINHDFATAADGTTLRFKNTLAIRKSCGCTTDQ